MAIAQKAPGVRRIRIDREAWNVTIWYDPALTDPARLQLVLDRASEEVDSLH